MKTSRFLAYASLVIIIAGGAIWYIIDDYYTRQGSNGTADADVVMYKNEGCNCCDDWAEYMQGSGYTVKTVVAENLSAIKVDQGIPRNMGACHTAIIGDYVVEGHVPAGDVKKLIEENPSDAAGLVVPGMPASSPGMNTELGEPFETFLLKSDGSTEVYAQH